MEDMTEPAARGWSVEELDEGRYLVHGTAAGDRVDVEVTLDPGSVEEFGLDGVPGERIVDATIGYLLEHQRLDELPAEVELSVVAAAYPDFADRLREELSAG
ncbi:hypothetical protein [Ornithinicoccus hortensis]|uniref:Uncharacterized protein n=1 Tax=Ornithinicoccus hortensis TaxID=82346 RepID=A0A542YUP5_9MICO|nr:hypothetical protein [Ornithinicoccus hortensis]TQL51806.1 hypothetical protein FB467_2969 [Ornithinicoccus hortensis]